MLKYGFKPFLIFMVLASIIFGLSSSNFFSYWMMLELNMVSFVLVLLLTKVNSMEASIKYFLIQAISSSMLIFSFLILISLKLKFFLYLCMGSLVWKLGAAPFHQWYMNLINCLDWPDLFLLSTIQKFLPLFLLLNFCLTKFVFFLIGLNVIVSLKLVYSEVMLKKILAASSIYSMSWILSSMSHLLSIFFLSIYSLNLFFLIAIFFNSNPLNIYDFSKMQTLPKIVGMMLVILSMSGVPPLLGFYPKLVIVMKLLMNDFFYLSLFLVQSTVLFLYIYLSLFLENMNLGRMILPWTKESTLTFKIISSVLVMTAFLFIFLHSDV